MSRPAISLLLASLLTPACAAPPEAPTNPPPITRDAPTLERHSELAERITAAGYVGAFVVLDPTREALIFAESEPELAQRPFIPASTFKIVNSLIALETGVAETPEFMLEWDGVERWFAAWNRDHDMRSAFEVSAVWYYQELARRIGAQRMAEWLGALDYGNADSSGGIDTFWLNGNLRVSAREQVEFLRRLHEGATPFSPRTVELFLDQVMIPELRSGATIRAKTGWARTQDFEDPASAGFDGHLGWFVGSPKGAESPRVYFATLLLAPEPAPDTFSADRRALSEELLRELGYLVADAAP
jgi:beta-lactamase class D